MLFDHDNLSFDLLDVLEFDDTDTVSRTKERSFCALSLRMEGDSDILCRGRTVTMRDRDLAFFPANLAYLRKTRRDRMIVFHFTLTGYGRHEIQVLHDYHYDELLPLFWEARQVWRERLPGYRYTASACLYRIFALLCAARAESRPEFSPPIAAALAEMECRLADPCLRIGELAASVQMCETYFRRQFRQELGISPKAYLSRLRMERAQALLNAGYDSVASAAEKSGFGDPKNFATAFKKHFGYPPSRQQYIP